MKTRRPWSKMGLAAKRKRRASVVGRVLLALAILHEDAACRDEKESNSTNGNGSDRSVGAGVVVSWGNRSRWVYNCDGSLAENGIVEPNRGSGLWTLLTSCIKSNKD